MGSFAGVTLRGDRISYRDGLRRETHPVAGVEAWVESAGQIDRRLSATRTAGGLMLLGPLGAVLGAIAKKRTDDRQLFLIVKGPDFGWAAEVALGKKSVDGRYDQRQRKRAQRFAAEITAAGARG